MVEKYLKRGGGLGRPRRALVALAASVMAAGCYSYTEISPAAVPPGSYVRVRVEPGTKLDGGTGAVEEGVRSVRGTVLAGGPSETLRLATVLRRRDDAGTAARGLRSTVSIPLADVERVELRRFEKRRTAFLIGGSTLGALIITEWAFNVLNPSADANEGGGTADNARIVLFRLRW